MDKKILIFILLGMFLFLPLVSSSDSCINRGVPNPLKVNQAGQLIQTCDTCSYVNITQITTPSGLKIINKQMTKNGTTYNYTYIPTEDGVYFYTVGGDKDGTYAEETLCFEVTASGGKSVKDSYFFIIIFIAFYGITFYGLRIKHEWVTLVGSFGLLLLGIYTSFYGIGYYKNDLTSAISYITLAIGLGLGFETLREITYY